MRTIEIKGMSCQHCVGTVAKAVGSVPGVASVAVSLERQEASFEESAPVDLEAVRAAVRKAGFEAGAEKA
jgi:copper chaperone